MNVQRARLEGDQLARMRRWELARSVLEMSPPDAWPRSLAEEVHRELSAVWWEVLWDNPSISGTYAECGFNQCSGVLIEYPSPAGTVVLGRFEGEEFVQLQQAHIAEEVRTSCPAQFTWDEHLAVRGRMNRFYELVYERSSVDPLHDIVAVDFMEGWYYIQPRDA